MRANILDDFWNYNAPCPNEIPNCASLKAAYQREVSQTSQQRKCTDCNLLDIKVKYANLIFQAINSK